uniref:Uncharacterized protein n=1 Tax=Nelumbo nucifera TaxID=4432 RepID=A0A822ZHC4_NELNU|nr:TPA_asm: hypothetical protein HUJ06_003724 [Nelumbo nucifera]
MALSLYISHVKVLIIDLFLVCCKSFLVLILTLSEMIEDWLGGKDGEFYVSSFYNKLTRKQDQEYPMSLIWYKYIHSKFAAFIRSTYFNKISAKGSLLNRGVGIDSTECVVITL